MQNVHSMNQDAGLNGRPILITGATGGLGLAMARALVGEGADVLISGRDQSKIDRTVSILSGLLGESAGALTDVAINAKDFLEWKKRWRETRQV